MKNVRTCTFSAGSVGRVVFVVLASAIMASCTRSSTDNASAPVITTSTAGKEANASGLVVDFSPANGSQFRRNGGFFGARPAMTQAQYAARNLLVRGPDQIDLFPKPHSDSDFIANALAGRTITTFSAPHGFQVAYADRDGTISLWYPGNNVILHGQWRILSDNATADIDDPVDGIYRGTIHASYVCSKYGKNTFNPVTRNTGDAYDCGSYPIFGRTFRETRQGDIFNLARSDVPKFALGREFQSINSLQKRFNSIR